MLKRRNFAWISFVTLTIMMMVVVPPIHGDFNPAATIQDPNSQIDMDQPIYEFDSPPTEVGDTFYVDVIGYNISEVFAYQVVIDYNASQLSCLDAWPDGGGWTDPDWIFYGLQTWGTAWSSYADQPSAGRNAELIGDSLKKAEDEVNLTDPASEALLARFEFEILDVPEPYEELSCVISVTSSWAVGTFVQSVEEASALQKRSPNLTDSTYSCMHIETLSHIIVWEDLPPFHVLTVSNGSVSYNHTISSGITFIQPQGVLTFNVTGMENTTSFCNITIPRELLDSPPSSWLILVGGETADYIVTQNDTHSSLWFNITHSQSTLGVEVFGETVIPEFPIAIIPALFIVLTLLGVALRKTVWSRKRGSLVAQPKSNT